MKILLYPCAIAAAIATPKAADFPLPRAAVRETVLRRVFSAIASMNVRTEHISESALIIRDK